MVPASLCAGVVLAALVLPQAAAATDYIAPDPGGDENTFPGIPVAGKLFGMNDSIVDFANGQSPESYAKYVENVGGNSIRTILDWAWAEPVEQDELAEIRFTKWRAVYDTARAHGLRPIFLLASAPYWAREDPATGDTCAICPYPPADTPEMNAEWGEFVTEVATRFPNAIIQVWNEPNLHYWWGFELPDPERYAELVDIAYDAVQQVEIDLGVNIPVIAPGLANVPEEEAVPQRMSLREFLDRAYAAPTPLDENIDGLATNAFPHSLTFGANTLLAATFEDLRAAQATAGDTSQIWVTETGVHGGEEYGYWSESIRADRDYRLYNRLASMPDVRAVLFHRIIEPVENDFGNFFEYGLAWMRYQEPPEPQTQGPQAVPKQVYCLFAYLATGYYAPCLETTITKGPRKKTKKRSATFRFDLAKGAFLTAMECSLDGAEFAPCETGISYGRLKRGRHVFEVRGYNGIAQRGEPDRHRWKIKKKRRRR